MSKPKRPARRPDPPLKLQKLPGATRGYQLMRGEIQVGTLWFPADREPMFQTTRHTPVGLLYGIGSGLPLSTLREIIALMEEQR